MQLKYCVRFKSVSIHNYLHNLRYHYQLQILQLQVFASHCFINCLNVSRLFASLISRDKLFDNTAPLNETDFCPND